MAIEVHRPVLAGKGWKGATEVRQSYHHSGKCIDARESSGSQSTGLRRVGLC
jgi:hypothetical protein